jgi:HNH endonuclease
MIAAMDEPSLPPSAELLASRLCDLRRERRQRQARRREKPLRRQALSVGDRATVLAKTAGRCHICGGDVVERWQADHVLAHAGGGRHAVDNYLPAHALCNNYRWDYSAEEFQWILKIGVWARRQMERSGSSIGRSMLKGFFDYECRREDRRVRRNTPASDTAE